MKSESQIMSELSHKVDYLRELSSEESAQLKNAILDIYKDVAALCDKYELTYMMSGGTCLGAVRHRGFIPWDDDLDIMMPRVDYNVLLDLLNNGELGDKYEYAYPNKSSDANTVFLKIFRKNSKDLEIHNVTSPFPKGIFMDVFPLDVVPDSIWGQKIKGFIANSIQFISICRLYTQYPSSQLKEFMNQDSSLKKRYIFKKVIGTLCGFASHRKWIYWFDKFVASSKNGNQWGLPTGRKYYNGEIFDKDVYVPVTKGSFEGLQVNLPHQTDRYLRNLYNNYMELPPLEKRERHFICEFELPKE